MSMERENDDLEPRDPEELSEEDLAQVAGGHKKRHHHVHHHHHHYHSGSSEPADWYDGYRPGPPVYYTPSG
jgi:hypothetical protein